MSTDGSAPSAVERLALSRERLRKTMQPPAEEEIRHAGAEPAWLHGLKSIPGAQVVIDAVRSWWSQHPARVWSMVAADASKTLLGPMVKRNPLGLVLGAVIVGGVIVWIKPWRGLLKPALFAGLLPQLVSKAVANVPVESWMAVLTSLAAQSQRRAPAEAPVPPAPEAADASATAVDAATPPVPSSTSLH